jgi:3-dehydroquinate synthase
MEKKKYIFSQKTSSYYFNTEFSYLEQLADRAHAVIITDENIFGLYKKKLKGWKLIVLKPGEQYKVQATVDDIVQQLIAYKVDRKSFLIGIGGGVITDITGYAASVYMRGISFGFVPVSLLAMVDAGIGGKNGIDVGAYKNFVGTIRQPDFLLYDSSFLKTLPQSEWTNGFAEIIKHACIKDARLFEELEQNSISYYKNNTDEAGKLIKRNAIIKSNVVLADEFEQGERKLLNFGHTWGHAVETKLSIPHGHAVAIGMVMACRLSEKLTGFNQSHRITDLLKKYGLPVHADVNKKEIFEVLKMDKKKDRSSMNYVLLNDIGVAIIRPIPFDELENLISDES